MIQRLLKALGDLGLEPTAEEIADALWLAENHRVAVRPGRAAGSGRTPSEADFAVLPRTVDLARALRPLRTVGFSVARRSGGPRVDEEMTPVTAQGLPAPRLPARAARPVDLTLVIDSGPSMELWRPTVQRFRSIMGHLGVFDDVRTWTLEEQASDDAPPTLRTEGGAAGRRPAEVITPSRRQFILVLSDCVGSAWWNGSLPRLIGWWGRRQPVAIVQLLPQRLWRQTALRPVPVRWQGGAPPGLPNCSLSCRLRRGGASPAGVAIPVLELERRWLTSWAAVVSGSGAGWVNGLAHVVDPHAGRPDSRGGTAAPLDDAFTSARDRVRSFLSTASPEAADLAGYLAAAAPLSLPVMRLVQREMAPRSLPGHLAEVFLGGLLRRIESGAAQRDATYDFHPGVRELLLARLTRAEAARTLGVVSDALSQQHGWSMPEARTNRGGSGSILALNRTVLQRVRGSGNPVQEPLEPPRASSTVQPAGTMLTTGPEPVARPSRTPPVWGAVPSANPHFTGRDAQLAELRAKLDSGGSALLTCTLHGMGGVGKTQLAVEYAYQHAADYDLVWWVPAQQRASVLVSLTELSSRLKLPGPYNSGEPWTRALAALRCGEPYRRWLLIYDNADRPEDIGELLPQGSGHLLITSRNPVWALRTDAVDVGVLTLEESVRLLRKHLHAEHLLSDTDAERVAHAAGGLPIALVQAAQWQATTGMSVDEHLRRFEQVLPSMLSDDLPPGYPASLYATWQMAIEKLRRDNPAAVDLLELCALLAPEPIPLGLLAADADTRLPESLAATLRDPVACSLALRDLRRLALVRLDLRRHTVEVHRLIQAVARRKEAMPVVRRVQFSHAVHCLLLRYAPADPEDPANWVRFQEIQPHLLPSEALDCELPEVRRLFITQVRYLNASGDTRSSRELAELARLRWSGMFGDTHPDVRAVRRHLVS
ncbi:FxSxx-COOH system tetratricopeptide repeat protein [Streptomyces sp. 7N604]|uniref:FxSxx-COOH system tetratricopeptide repeat protein n=1 Tax=Streptomyces sp. 7N604 TaxID=3457415 RepID=UPI003FD114D4